LRILIVSQYFWPENFRINELSIDLHSKGHKVTVLTAYPNYPEGFFLKDFLKNKKNYSNYHGIEVIRVPIIPRGKRKVQLILNYLSFIINGTLIGLYKLRKYNFDIVFVFQTSPVFVGIPSSIISYIKKCPQIFWVLDLWPETLSAINIIKNKWLILLIRKIVKLIYSRCEVILVQSKSFINEIKKYGHKKVHYFPAWVESEFLDSPANLAKEINREKEIFTIIFAGNIGKAQDFPSILKTVELLINNNFHNFRIVTIGEGSEKAWLINEVYERKLNNYFQILDQYPLKKMKSFFAHADALLVTLSNANIFKMTIPGKIQTYLASGVPILGMLSGEGAFVIKESKAGYVCKAGDYEGLASLIMKMSKNKKKKKAMLGNNGIEYYKQEFNKTSLLKKLESIMFDL